jgi:hypothetical protein
MLQLWDHRRKVADTLCLNAYAHKVEGRHGRLRHHSDFSGLAFIDILEPLTSSGA